jgi:hypothetical protein
MANAPLPSFDEHADDVWEDVGDLVDNETELSAEGGEHDILLEYARRLVQFLRHSDRLTWQHVDLPQAICLRGRLGMSA